MLSEKKKKLLKFSAIGAFILSLVLLLSFGTLSPCGIAKKILTERMIEKLTTDKEMQGNPFGGMAVALIPSMVNNITETLSPPRCAYAAVRMALTGDIGDAKKPAASSGTVKENAPTPADKVLGEVSINSADSDMNADEKAYLDKVALKNIEVGKSVLDERGVFGEIKNTGDRTLSQVEIIVYFLDEKGSPVYEKNYTPVLQSSYRPTPLLKSGYSQKFGMKAEDAPSEWSGKVSVKITSVKFDTGQQK